MSVLRDNQKCPLHRGSRTCCGRKPVERTYKNRAISGILYLADGREKCSPAALRRRKDRLLATHPFCAACGEKFTDYRDVDLAHKVSKGMSGSKHNDAWDNITLMHHAENLEMGSMTMDQYLAWRREKGLPTP